MTSTSTAGEQLLVQVGDLIATGSGDNTSFVMIVWTNRSYVPGARDALNTPQEAPSSRATPADAICLLPPRGDGQFMGTAMLPSFMTYLGWQTFSDDEMDAADAADNEFAAREGHTWRVEVPGYRHIKHDWWGTFRGQSMSA